MAALGLMFVFLYAPELCQAAASFTSEDVFEIPSSNGDIRFGFNGTYSAAALNGAAWQFTDLALNGTVPLGSLKIAAENSNVTIQSLRTGNLFLRSAVLLYYAEGKGTQTINLCLNSTQSTIPSEWSVITTGGVFLAEGNGWQLLPDDSVVVSGIEGAIRVVHYNFQTPDTSNQTFFEQHSVGLASAAAVAATVAVALAIKYRVRH
jgi:hypothetical protein